MTDTEQIPLGWSDQLVPLHSYVAFYYSDDQTVAQSLAFLLVGLDEPGTFCVVLADASRQVSILQRLREGYSGPLDDLLARGKLATVGGSSTFEELGQSMASRIDQALADGYQRVRALGWVAWGQPGWPDASSVKRCEAEVNRLARAYPVVIVCTYNVPQLPGEAVRENALGNKPEIVVNQPI